MYCLPAAVLIRPALLLVGAVTETQALETAAAFPGGVLLSDKGPTR